ncbi:MAG: type II secretion system F family protein [Humidesulfovibrio sp.]|uniref:type II secretion system F family protein n=1 Tax=Humidesulfovibrio sp. TaxID=2910988 RepID=UPI0027370199|nr:type II secretion system F family protein [Humidesulfovibrio sp.]MDP2847426.1 type II secretion system F family protein [Humidesulfovibrio sp.]
MPLLIAVLATLAVLLLCLFLLGVAQSGSTERRQRVDSRLAALAMAGPDVSTQDIVRRTVYSEVPWLHRFLSGLNWTRAFDKSLRQAGIKGFAGVYILAAALIFCVTLALIQLITGSILAGIIGGLALCPAPFLRVRRQRAKRMAAFGRQLPDALDLIARALKAGNTFSGGMRMVADEFPDPIGPEFGITLDEINFGVDTGKALESMLSRVDCPDLRFFVVSVNIQRETGGNLSEIVGNTASLIRERFKLLGRVRILSAEGRLSAMVLLAMPFAIAFVIYLINPDYMSLLFTEPLGRMLIAANLVLMAIGTLCIRKMVNFRI